jgi:hypothetical protein
MADSYSENQYLKTYFEHYKNASEEINVNSVEKLLANFVHLQDVWNQNINDIALTFGILLRSRKNIDPVTFDSQMKIKEPAIGKGSSIRMNKVKEKSEEILVNNDSYSRFPPTFYKPFGVNIENSYQQSIEEYSIPKINQSAAQIDTQNINNAKFVINTEERIIHAQKDKGQTTRETNLNVQKEIPKDVKQNQFNFRDANSLPKSINPSSYIRMNTPPRNYDNTSQHHEIKTIKTPSKPILVENILMQIEHEKSKSDINNNYFRSSDRKSPIKGLEVSAEDNCKEEIQPHFQAHHSSDNFSNYLSNNERLVFKSKTFGNRQTSRNSDSQKNESKRNDATKSMNEVRNIVKTKQERSNLNGYDCHVCKKVNLKVLRGNL